MHQFIVIEGLDGVGKSELAHYISTEYGRNYLKTPPLSMERERQKIEQANISAEEKFAFYLHSIQVCIAQMNKEQFHIVDRFIYSSVIAHAWRSSWDINSMWKFYKNLKDQFPAPKFILQIVCNYDERLKRIEKRKIKESDKSDDVSSQFNSFYTEAYSLFNSKIPNWYLIDNSQKLSQTKQEIDELFKMMNICKYKS